MCILWLIENTTPDDLRHYPLGSVLNGAGVAPDNDKLASPGEWLKLADRFYEASMAAPHAVPVIWGTDAIHGTGDIPGATIFPHNIGFGAARDPALIERIGAITALEVRVTGLDWTSHLAARADGPGRRTRRATLSLRLRAQLPR